MLYVIDKKIPKRIMGDALRLQQVISNLLGNAIKFTPEGGTITLSVVMHEMYEEKVYMEFSVKDTGIGIPKEAQERIFKPFSQADGGVTRTFGGTGLGLTISQKILQAMHSKLELQSFLRQGSTFSFKVFFDRDLSIVESEEGEVPTQLSFALYPPRLARKTSYERLNMILEKMGTIDYISNIASGSHYDVIFLFGYGHIMDDYHTLRLYYPMTPVIYIGDEQIIEMEDRQHFDGFYKNPILESHLKATVKELTTKVDVYDVGVDVKFEGNILVAEDNTTNRLLVQILLEKTGLKVDFAKDGYEAIAAARKNVYDLILMDIHMPKKDGVAATKEIILGEKDDGRPHTPIIAVTANALKGDREKYIEAGMDDYMSKPINESQLHEILAKYLAKGGKAEEPAYDEIAVPKSAESIDYDLEVAAEKVGVDRMTMDMLVDNYFMTFEADFDKLRNAVALMDQKAIIETAHYLKGAAMNLQFEKGSEMFKEVERFAKDGQLDWIQLDRIHDYFEGIKTSIANQ